MAVVSEKPEIDYIRYLKNNLLDSYKYGDGFTVFKELIQNASDASSDSLKVYVLDTLKNAKCAEALRTPAIVVYDDGNFDKKNKNGILKIASDNKTSESTKIGRYGLGMKSIFHICDFFIYAANTKDFPYERVFPVNYWPEEDSRFKNFSDADIDLLLNSLPKEIDIRKQKGFILYIPFKITKSSGWENVTTNKVKEYPFGSLESLKKRIPISLALLSEVAPQEKKLKTIFYKQADNIIDVSVDNKHHIKSIKTEFNKTKSEIQFITYKPELSKDLLNKIERLKKSEYWTKEQKDNLKPEMCFELLKTEKEQKDIKAKLKIDFCVYLPLEEEYCSKSFEIDSKYNYTILFHSNFAVDSGRRGIRGFGDLLDEATEAGIDSEEGIQKLWNKYLAQMVLFPSLPLFLNEANKLIKEHNDFCEITNKLYETVYTYSEKNIRLCNKFTTKKFGFANIYNSGWSSFELEEEKSNYIFLPYSKDNKEIQILFPIVKDKNSIFILKTPEQKFILPDYYRPDEKYLCDVIRNIPSIGLTEEKYIIELTQFIDYQKNVIRNSIELSKVLIEHIKALLCKLTFEELSKNQTKLAELFEKVNEATGDSPYKVYSIGQKDKSDLLKNYTIEDFKQFWSKETSFIFIPGFIDVQNDLIPQIKTNVFEGNNSICEFISNEDNCRGQLHFNILSSILGNLFDSCLKAIAGKYQTLQIFRVTEAYTNKPETLNYQLIKDLIDEKKIFMTQSNPSNKETVFFNYVKTIYPINIYHISKKIRDLAGLGDNEIPTSDEPLNIFASFVKLYNDSIKQLPDGNYEVNLDLTNEYWEALLDEGFKKTFKINESDKQFYRFLFSGFDKQLREEPLASFDRDIPEVWKEVFKNIAPDAKKIPASIPARAKEQIELNKTLLNIEPQPLNKNTCRDRLRNYVNNNGNLDFFKTEYFQNEKNQKVLLENFRPKDKQDTNAINEQKLFEALPIHKNAKTGEFVTAEGQAFLNPNEIIFPPECDIQIKLIKISDDPDLAYIQNRFIKNLTIKDAVIEALKTKKTDSNISQWVFNKMKEGGTHWKEIFENNDGHFICQWIPLKTGRNKKFCDIQEILNDDIFSTDSREWISDHYEMYNLSDLDISDTTLLKEKKLIAETVSEQMEYLGRKVDKSLSFKLYYSEENSLFSDSIILKDFKKEPIFGLINILKQERRDKTQEVFNFYQQRRTSNERSKRAVFEEILNYICDNHEVTQATLILYENILDLLLREGNFDISAIKYPTQNNEWKEAKYITASNSSSISKEYLLNEKIYKQLSDHSQISEDNYVDDKEVSNDEIILTDSSEPKLIQEVFSQWESSLDKKKLLYLFFYLLKENFKKIAEEKLTEKDLLPLTKDLYYISLRDFGESGRWWNAGYSKEEALISNRPPRGIFRARIHIPKGKQAKVHSLTGSLLLIDMVDGNEIYTDEPWYYNYTNQLNIHLINTNGRINNLDEKLEKLIWLIWKKGYKQTSEAEFTKMLHNFKESNQNTIKTAQYFMFENLILHLKDLNLNHKLFKEIFSEYNTLLNEKARRINNKIDFPEYVQKKDDLSQFLIDFITENINKEKWENNETITRLLNLIVQNDYKADFFVDEIFKCVVNKINQAKYDQSRKLFELLQNADDAVKDLAENNEDIKGRTRFEVTDTCNKVTLTPAIHISHFGRYINESLNKEKEEVYSNDLLNMLLINSSEKDESSTGKFGLGFKSVYFVCQEPIIRSGDLQFKILGALYPENEKSEPLRNFETRIELTLNKHAETEVIYGDFENNADLQVLFCKYIDEIKIRKNTYKPELKSGSKNSVGLYYSENKKYIRFLLKNGSLVFKVSPDTNSVESFGDSSVSRVWNLTPLATAKTLPFAINSKFEVDIGRKNLDEQNILNERLLTTLANEFSSVICEIIESKDKDFETYIPSILNLILIGCRIQDSDILTGFCKKVLNDIFIKVKIIPDGIGGIVNNPITPFYIAPNQFNLEYDTKNFNEFLIRLQSVIKGEEVVTKNVAGALSASSLEFNEIDGRETILRLIANGTKITNEAAVEFIKFVDLMPSGLPTTFNWDMFKVLDNDGEWEPVRTVLLLQSFSDNYSDIVIQFFKSHITFVSYSSNSYSNRPNEPENDNDDNSPIKYPRCSVIDVYNNWKTSVDSGIWNTLKQEYYNRIFPISLADTNTRKHSLAISPEFFENYSENRKTMPESWCTLFMLGTLQSLNYFGELRTESARKNKMENMSGLIKEFSDGETLDNLYDHYLDSHTTDEDDLLEFESLLRVYKFRRQFMDVWSNFHGLKYSKEITKETLINTSASAEATGRALQIYCSKKSLKYGISLIVRELLDSDFYGTKDEERNKAFELLNQYTYIPHAYLRRIVFDDWSEYPSERTSEEIHEMIKETLQNEGLDDDEIKGFMKCHDLPFLIFGEKK